MPNLSRRGVTKPCLNCLSDFYRSPSMAHQEFCSRRCRSEYIQKNRIPGGPYALRQSVCEFCGKQFESRFSEARRKKTCSKDCQHKLKGKNRKSGKTFQCAWCDTEVYVSKSRIKPNKKYFCCHEHANLYQGRNKTVHTCKVCSKEFRRSPYWVNSGIEQKYCSQECYHNDPETKQRLIDLNLVQQSLKINKVERIGYNLLDGIGLLYFRQYLISRKFCVDAFFFTHNLVIQFDGDYWHGHPEKFPNPDDRQKKRMRLDRSQDAHMKKSGYRVLRIWEGDLKKHPEQVIQRIRSALSVR